MTENSPSEPELSRRQEQLLASVVTAYTSKQEPVSSKYLMENAGLSVSSATIRNELAALDELGYISAPHTSAGRVPTEKGYRYFVQRLVKNGDLSLTEQTYISEKFQTLPLASEQWMRVAASLLARITRSASIVTPPIAETSRFKHVELIAIQGRLVLMVLVLHGGTVHQRMLNLAEPVPQIRLAEVANYINSICIDLYANDLRMKAVKLNLLDREVVELAAEIMDRSDNNQVRLVYREGLSDILSSFPDGEGAQQAVRLLEERAFINLVLNDLLDPFFDDIKVIVAGEGRQELNQLSMVMGRYGVPGQMTGAVGVFGPTHINYGRAISTVRYVSSLMTNMLVELYKDDDMTATPNAEPQD